MSRGLFRRVAAWSADLRQVRDSLDGVLAWLNEAPDGALIFDLDDDLLEADREGDELVFWLLDPVGLDRRSGLSYTAPQVAVCRPRAVGSVDVYLRRARASLKSPRTA